MDYLNNVYGLLLIFGSAAIIVVVILYFLQKRKMRLNFKKAGEDESAQVIQQSFGRVELDTKALTAHLSPFRENQPVFIHNVVNLLERAKRASDIKMIKVVTSQLESQKDLLNKIDEYEDIFHKLEGKKKDFEQGDEIKDLTHELDKKTLLKQIKDLADETGSKDEKREQELDGLKSKLIHETKIKEIKDSIAANYEAEKRRSKSNELKNTISVFEKQFQAIEGNQNLPPAAKKEALRTLEETFIAQLDDFKRGL